MKTQEKHNFAKSSKQPNFHFEHDSFLFNDFQKNFISQKNNSVVLSNDFEAKLEEEKPFNTILIKKSDPNEKTTKKPLTTGSKSDVLKPKTSKMVKKFILKLKEKIKKFKTKQSCFIYDLSNPEHIFPKKQKLKKLNKTLNCLRKLFLVFIKYSKCNEIMEKCLNMPMIHPFKKFRITWDFLIFLNTLFLFFYIPLTTCFDILDDNANVAFESIEIVIYIVELIINLNTAQFIDGVLVENRMKIWLNYKKKFIILDVIALISLIATKTHATHSSIRNSLMSFAFYAKFKIFKAEFLKIKEFFSLKIHKHFFLEICVLLVSSFLLVHFFACMFHFIAISSADNHNWLNYYGIIGETNDEQYLYSLYWSMNTLLYVGYGDILPQNNNEMIFSLISMMVGLFLYSYNINKIGRIFFETSKDEMKIEENISKISTFMESKHLNGNLQMRVRSYLKFIWEKENEKMNEDLCNIINSLSTSLKDEIYLEAYGFVIKDNPFFKDNFSNDFLCELTKNVEEQSFLKNEVIFQRNSTMNPCLYLVKTGEIEIFHYNSKNHPPIIFDKLKAKEFFGQYSFFTGFNQLYSTRASENSILYVISRNNFLNILKKFPEDYESFCEFKDKVALSNEFPNFDIKCPLCKIKDHFINSCKLTTANLVVDHKKFLEKSLYSQNQTRNPFKRKQKKVSSLKFKKKLINFLDKFNPQPVSIISFDMQQEQNNFSEECSNENLDDDLLSPVENSQSQESFDEKFKKKINAEDNGKTLASCQKTINHQGRLFGINANIDSIKHFDSYFNNENVENFLKRINKIRKKKRTNMIEVEKFNVGRILKEKEEAIEKGGSQSKYNTVRERPLEIEKSKIEIKRIRSFFETK